MISCQDLALRKNLEKKKIILRSMDVYITKLKTELLKRDEGLEIINVRENSFQDFSGSIK